MPDLPEDDGMRWVADGNREICEERALLRCTICGTTAGVVCVMCVQRLVARQWLWCSASAHSTERRAEACQEVLKLLHSRDSVIFFKVLRVFLGAVQEAQDA